jgi:glyceraldehyde 3-phosphate dehydrogenase
VIISAPSGDADASICMGVNDSVYDASAHSVISNASCTTNCLAPMAKVLNDTFGIEQGLMTTVHAYTSDQSLVDLAKATRSGKPDLRRMRSAALSIIPNSSGAARAIGLVLPELAGKVDGISVRAPVPTGSITDFVVQLGRETTVAEVNAAFAAAAETGPLSPYLEYTEEPFVSTDIVHSSASCTFDSQLTMVHGSSAKVFGWYDNEWGYSCRLVDLVPRVL